VGNCLQGLVRKCEQKRALERPGHRREEILNGLNEGVKLINQTQERSKWQAVVFTVMNCEQFLDAQSNFFFLFLYDLTAQLDLGLFDPPLRPHCPSLALYITDRCI
jgi:hypothetical protein